MVQSCAIIIIKDILDKKRSLVLFQGLQKHILHGTIQNSRHIQSNTLPLLLHIDPRIIWADSLAVRNADGLAQQLSLSSSHWRSSTEGNNAIKRTTLYDNRLRGRHSCHTRTRNTKTAAQRGQRHGIS